MGKGNFFDGMIPESMRWTPPAKPAAPTYEEQAAAMRSTALLDSVIGAGPNGGTLPPVRTPTAAEQKDEQDRVERVLEKQRKALKKEKKRLEKSIRKAGGTP